MLRVQRFTRVAAVAMHFQVKCMQHSAQSSRSAFLRKREGSESTTCSKDSASISMTHKPCHFMRFLSDSNIKGADHVQNDPEVNSSMNEITQDMEQCKNEPFHVKSEEIPESFGDLNTSKNTAHVEIEEFDYFDEEQEISIQPSHKFYPVSFERGVHGVFDVKEIVKVLEYENGVDVKVIDIAPEINFVDYMVIVSGKSLRHMRAMASTIEFLYKQKKNTKDKPFKLEGRDCKEWLAMDLGNIAVHIFMPEAREHYDLETLWLLGPEHDGRQHCIENKHINLTAEELFWLESAGWNSSPTQDAQSDQMSSAARETDAADNVTHMATSEVTGVSELGKPKLLEKNVGI